jgi:two-component system sensor histidine kinase UhpB
MSLRLQVNLVLASVIAVFVCALLALGVLNTRASVTAETLAAHKVATYLMEKIAVMYRGADLPKVESELQRLGHVRSAEITLYAPSGQLLYRSPPATYKAGRYAPRWYSRLVAPAPMTSRISFADATVVIRADASRAVLDGWDESVSLTKIGVAVLVLGNLLVFWLIGRATRPFRTIVDALERMEAGDYRSRLPDLHGGEAGKIAHAFNRAAQAIEDNLSARSEAAAATLRAEHHRSLAVAVQERLDNERRRFARELHDETSQSITAIRSMALALTRADAANQTASRETVRLIAATASELYAAVHNLIPRLDAPDLEQLSLSEAIAERVPYWRREYPGVAITTTLSLPVDELGTSYALAAYRIVQESVANACKHAGARKIDIVIDHADRSLRVQVCDDGRGLAADWQRPGHFGVRGMCERAEALGGSVVVENRAEGGVRVRAVLPLE